MHTKGEWKLSLFDQYKGKLCVYSGDNKILALIPFAPDDQVEDKNYNANAQLIASAPELKQVAIECLQWFRVQDKEIEPGRAWHKNQLKKQLKQAISKAEGKEDMRCWSCNKIRAKDFPVDEQGNKYCPDCNTNQ